MSDLTNLLGPNYTSSDLFRARGAIRHKGETLWVEERVNELVIQEGIDDTEAKEQAEHELCLILSA